MNFHRDAVFKFDKLALDILAIALPAALALAADPIASLIDTAFVGHIGTKLLHVLSYDNIYLNCAKGIVSLLLIWILEY